MKHTGNMGKIGRRFDSAVMFCHHPAFTFSKSRTTILSFLLHTIITVFVILFSHWFIWLQVAAVVRNRSTEMVEALYSMNRVHRC